MTRILILGGYGVFGQRIASQLSRDANLEITIAGRSRDKALSCARTLQESSAARISTARIDATSLAAADLKAFAPQIVINASGPFQTQNYSLAEACIGAGCHYVDLADGRAFVAGITALDARARDAGVSVISGASSVPALSSAVVQAFETAFSALEALEIAISPGSGFEPGEATIAAGLSYLGKPIGVRQAGRSETVYGWQGLRKRSFGSLGRRWTVVCDVPDLDLFPARYPTLTSMNFRAGLEVGLMTLGLWALSWPARAGFPRHPETWAPYLARLRKPLATLGRNCGAMRVEMRGMDQARQPAAIEWVLTARDGHGLNVPTLASVIAARKLARGEVLPKGAMACFGLISLAEFEAEFSCFHITTSAQKISAA